MLELLWPELRRQVLDEAIVANERQLVQARTAAAGCPCRCRFVERCLARDVERWEAELVWLERLAEELATPQRRHGRPGRVDGRSG